MNNMQANERYMLHQYRQEHPAASPAPASNLQALGAMLARVDWYEVYIRFVWLLVLAAFAFAGWKLAIIWQAYPGAAFIPFLNTHPLLMVFSGLFTLAFIRTHEGMAFIALLSTGLNALLV